MIDMAQMWSQLSDLEWRALVLATEREMISCKMIEQDAKAAARVDQINTETTRLGVEAGKLKVILRHHLKREQPWRRR